MPEGWNATFRGGGRIIHSVFVETDSSETINLRLDPPENPESGELSFVVLAQGNRRKAELPLTLSVQEKVPAGLSFTTDLPVIKGSPTTTFRYTAKLENTGDEDLTVNMQADAPAGFLTKFKVSGQDVTNFPLGANQTKTINIELDPIIEMAAKTYYFTIYSSGGDLEASLDLAAEVTGQQELSVTGLDGRLSGEANAGKETPLQIRVRNTGTAAAQGVEMSATAPSGWTVTFDPEVIAEIPAGSQAEVTAQIENKQETTSAGDAWLGILGLTIIAPIAEATDLPADQEGVLIHGQQVLVGGDHIVAIDDQDITNFDDLSTIISKYQPNDQVTLAILRDEEPVDVQVTLGKKP
jgi:uncharacterized membrane protein